MRLMGRPLLTLALVALAACGASDKKSKAGDEDSGAATATPTGASGTATGGTGSATGGSGTAGTGGTGTGTSTDETGDTGGTTTGSTTPVGGPCSSTVDVCATGECIVDLLAESVTVLGQILYDGATINNDGDGDDYQIIFVDSAGNESIYSSPGGAGIYEAVVYPGIYDVYFELLDTTGTVPRPAQGRVAMAMSVDLTEDANLDILPSPLELAGSVSYDGDGIPRGVGSVWAVTLHDTANDLWFVHPKAGGTGVYDIHVWEGTYDVYFEILDRSVLPRSVEGLFRAAADVEITGDMALDLLLDTVQVQGGIRWNGAPLRDDADGLDNMALYFEDRATGQRLESRLPDGVAFYQIRLYPAEYDVWVELLDPADAVEDAVLGEWLYSESFVVAPPAGALEIDVSTVQLTGEVIYDESLILGVDGAPDWALHFTDNDTGATFTRTFTGGRPTYALNMLPGVYDVDFELLDRSAVSRPVEGIARVAEALDLTSVTTLDLDLTPSAISGELLYDGALIGRDDGGADYQLWLTNRATRQTVERASAGGEGDYTVYVLPGTWDIDFELVDLDGAVLFPAGGRYAAARGLEVLGDVALDIAPTTRPVGGQVLYDGLPIQAGPEREWQVVLTSRDIASVAVLPQDGGATEWEVNAYAGVWDVAMELLDDRAVLSPVSDGRFVGEYCADIR